MKYQKVNDLLKVVFEFVLICSLNALAGVFPPDEPYRSVPIPNLARPDYLVPVKDPAFGTQIIRITDSKAFGQSSVHHNYSKDCPWNCDQTLIKISKWILDGKTYKILRTITMPGEAKWSFKDPNKIFGTSGNRFVSVNATTGVQTILHTFSGYSNLYIGPWEGNLSADDATVVLLTAVSGNAGAGNVIVYDIANDQIIANKPLSSLGPYAGCDWASISQSGKYVVINWRQLGGAGGVVSYDRNLYKVADVVSLGEHGDIGCDAQGNDVFVQVCNFQMSRLDNGQKTTLFNSVCGHMSTRNFKRPGWCYSSFDGSQDVLAIKLDNSRTVERFTHHRSAVGQAQAVASPDGRKVMFASNWNGTAEVNSYVVCMSDGPYFCSPNLVSVPVGQNFSYLVKYENPLGTPVTVTYLKKPSWVVIKGDSIIGTAPSTVKTDTLVAALSASGLTDTLKLSIVVAQYFAFEAESGTLASPMKIGSNATASNGQYITPAAGIGNTIFPKAEATYTFNTPITENYYVWLRILAPIINTTANYGTFVGFNGTFVKPGVANRIAGQYEWIISPTTYSLNAGANQLVLGHGSEQVQIDKIIITNNPEAALPANYTSSRLLDKKNREQKSKLSVHNLYNGGIEFKGNFGNRNLIQITVSDVLGRTVWSYHQDRSGFGNRIVWDAKKGNSDLSSGLYFVTLKSQKGMMSELNKFTLVR